VKFWSGISRSAISLERDVGTLSGHHITAAAAALPFQLDPRRAANRPACAAQAINHRDRKHGRALALFQVLSDGTVLFDQLDHDRIELVIKRPTGIG
jgi:hypothetical protein